MSPIDKILFSGNDCLYVTPAYGRTYPTAIEALQDWKKGKDFSSRFGYCSIRDIPAMLGDGFGFVIIQLHNQLVKVSLK